jgi:hypothetical protein
MTCATCQWCQPADAKQIDPGAHAQCRRWPPTLTRVIWLGTPQARSIWPCVTQDDWCGEYLSRDAVRDMDEAPAVGLTHEAVQSEPEPEPEPVPVVVPSRAWWKPW